MDLYGIFYFHTLDAVGNICRKPMRADVAAGKESGWDGHFK